MGLLDIFKRGDGGARPASASTVQVALARTRAKRRLIGAVVLLGLGVIAFPLLFETQPRPIPVDIPIEIPARDGAGPLALPAPKPAAPAASKAAAVSPPPVPAEAPASALAAPRAAVPSVPPRKEPSTVAAAPTPAPVPAAAASKPPAAVPARFIVQVGAFAEASAVRETRAKLEKLGLSSYTQVVETANGQRTRVRVGPFNSREDADKAAAKVKAAGLAAAVLAP
jgi:DedD protein